MAHYINEHIKFTRPNLGDKIHSGRIVGMAPTDWSTSGQLVYLTITDDGVPYYVFESDIIRERNDIPKR